MVCLYNLQQGLRVRFMFEAAWAFSSCHPGYQGQPAYRNAEQLMENKLES